MVRTELDQLPLAGNRSQIPPVCQARETEERPGQTEARQRDAAGGGDLAAQLERERTEKEELRLRVDALQVELGAVGRREVLSNAISALRVSRPRGRWNGEGRVAGDAGAVRRDPDQEAEGRSA